MSEGAKVVRLTRAEMEALIDEDGSNMSPASRTAVLTGVPYVVRKPDGSEVTYQAPVVDVGATHHVAGTASVSGGKEKPSWN